LPWVLYIVITVIIERSATDMIIMSQQRCLSQNSVT